MLSEPGQVSWASLHPLASNCLLLLFPFMAGGSTWTIMCARQVPYPGATQPAYSFHTLMCYHIIPELDEVPRVKIASFFQFPFSLCPWAPLYIGEFLIIPSSHRLVVFFLLHFMPHFTVVENGAS